MDERHHQDSTMISPESVVRERLDFVVKQILQFSFPEIHNDAILWRNESGLHKLDLMENKALTIGRETSSDIMLTDNFTSRCHAAIEKKNGEWIVFDQNSKNGTWLNNHPIDAASMSSGDIIRIGDTYFVYMEASQQDFTMELEAISQEN